MKKYWYWVIFGLALALRLGYALVFSQDRLLHIDELGYYQVVKDFWLPGIEQNFNHHPPFYLLFLFGIFKVFGVSFTALQAVQSVLGGLVAILIIRIAKELALEKAGLFAALIYAVYPAAVKMPAMVMSETLFTFLLILAVWVFIKALNRIATTALCDSTGREHANGSATGTKHRLTQIIPLLALAGVLFGLTALTRSVALGLPFLLAFSLIIIKYRKRPGDADTRRLPTRMGAFIRENLRPTFFILIFLLAFSLPLIPWALRNHRLTGRFMAGSTSSGITFFWHNTPMMWEPGSDYISPAIKLSDLPKFSIRPSKPLPKEAWHPLIKQMQKKYTGNPGYIERSEFYMNEGLKYLGSLSAYEILKLELTKFWRLVLPYHEFYNPLYDFIFMSLLPFFLYGLYLMLFRASLFPDKQYFILVTLLVYLGLVTLVFGGMPRYRYPYDPYIFIIAVTGFFEYLNRTGKRWVLPAISTGLNICAAVLLIFI